MMTVSVEEWLSRLQKNFSHSGAVGGKHLLPLLATETRHAASLAQKFKGHELLEKSFLDFLVGTLDTASAQFQARSLGEFPWYLPTLTTYVSMLYGFRSASLAARHGYGFEGFAMLRNVKDQAFGLSSIVNDFLPMPAVQGFSGLGNPEKWTDVDLPRIRKNKIKNDRNIYRYMISKNEELSQVNIDKLTRWNDLFNQQIHGSSLSITREIDRWLVPKDAYENDWFDRSAAMYMNRFGEIGWMTLRLLPFLQPSAAAFGSEWARQWWVLDQSFRQSLQSLAKIGQEISSAVERLIDSRFAFDPTTRYFESFGSYGDSALLQPPG